MNLRLDGELTWRPSGQPSRPLPAVLPSALLLVLARHGQWVPRAKLAALFWPEAQDCTARLNLRVHLHRARHLVGTLPGAPLLECERHRVRWTPSIEAPQETAVAEIAAGLDLPGFDDFNAWLHEWRNGLRGLAADTKVDADDAGAAARGFFGRRQELARLRRTQQSVIVLAGEAGVGKSRLLAEAFAEAHWLRCQSGLMPVSFGVVAQLLSAQPDWLRQLGAYRLDLARLLPDIAPDEPLPPLDALTARVRLFEGLSRCAEANTGRLIVDDLQWADPATVDWLVQLAHRHRLPWVATMRPDELPASTAVALQGLECAGIATVVPIEGLDRSALTTMVEARRPDLAGNAAIASSWGDALARYTGGNAFSAIAVIDGIGPSDSPSDMGRRPLPERVATLLRARRSRLSLQARAIADAAALSVGRPTIAQLAAMAGIDEAAAVPALEEAQHRRLLVDTRCSHDMVRDALAGAIGSARRAQLHRRAAQVLDQEHAEPELIAHHWREAGQPDKAWPFVLRTALRLRVHGDHAAAVAALEELHRSCADASLVLHAEILLAQERLFDDLGAGSRALEAALAKTGGLVPGDACRQLEARALAGLIDNAVFRGDLARASALARRLRPLLDQLPADLLVEAHQVLIEVAMRRPDCDAAWRSVAALRQAHAPAPVVESFEGQIHWFCGAVREARRSFEHLLEQHPDYCRGLTIENDLAVMCHALGELGRAETMARRSLVSWAGYAHTEALSQLVLGATLTSGGRFDEARLALEQAHGLARQQGSDLFAGEALTRMARMHWCAGDARAAAESAAQARAAVGVPVEPLRASALGLMEVLADPGAGPAAASVARLARLANRSRHPVVEARYWRAAAARATAAGRRAEALAAARKLLDGARAASLAEWQAESLWLMASLDGDPAATDARCAATRLATERGFGWLTPQRLPSHFLP